MFYRHKTTYGDSLYYLFSCAIVYTNTQLLKINGLSGVQCGAFNNINMLFFAILATPFLLLGLYWLWEGCDTHCACSLAPNMSIVWTLCPLDLCCHGHKCLLYVSCILGTSFQKWNLKLVCKLLEKRRSACGHHINNDQSKYCQTRILQL